MAKEATVNRITLHALEQLSLALDFPFLFELQDAIDLGIPIANNLIQMGYCVTLRNDVRGVCLEVKLQ